MLNVNDVAKEYRVSITTVYRLLHALPREIQARCRVGCQWRIPRDLLDVLMRGG